MIDLEKDKERQVQTFLREFKNLVTNGGLYVIQRDINQKGLIDLGLTKKLREHEILSLSLSDFCEGPCPDVNKPGNIWIFGKEINGHEVYIKLKIVYSKPNQAICLSFHKAANPLSYPLKPNN